MTTNNAVNSGLSGTTGTGNFVGSTSPILITPTLGAASATSVTFSSTSGIIGSTTNDSAASGSVGQFVSSVIASGSAVSLAPNTAADLTHISLTAGDWDVWGNVGFIAGTGTTSIFLGAWLSSSSAAVPDPSLYGSLAAALTLTNNNPTSVPVPSLRFSLSGTTPIYISATSNFSVSTLTMCGGIYARRVR